MTLEQQESIELEPIEPITPKQARQKMGTNIPPYVIKAVNDLISENLRVHESSVTIRQCDILDRIINNLLGTSGYPPRGTVTKQEICDKGWLDFEPLYERAGWNVKYDKPGFNEIGR